ncbi:MAG: hypothetical protein MJ053_02155, partial [Elusimicrobiaceae bacterium]|nr:hypothetical protein [Elusimicrobiaceae bacterium]
MENEDLDLDVKPAGNKDLWLFLIIVDIVLLCVFGFFIYKYVSADLFRLPSSAAEQTTTTTQDLPEPEVEEVSAFGPEEQPIVGTAIPTEETLATDALAAGETPTAQTAEPVQEVVIEQPQQETKTSVLVEVNPKSNKYRKVTFRWFGEGESVAVGHLPIEANGVFRAASESGCGPT